ncbi:uncharacterized protein Dwil_GK24814 [Drosophila willistoni]|uniref:Adenosine 5'-monophosphoramidase HINT3 n=1 Tax=Drosophila willistoni TaxID=7260 RepID=B4N194_DROWI|nr:adenosine 5'-monophosphoramidase HINT3 [Drosophila willistoni]EDW78087.2 uncharacterized protein Dwil_GK24814 [Drosophila willistoni]
MAFSDKLIKKKKTILVLCGFSMLLLLVLVYTWGSNSYATSTSLTPCKFCDFANRRQGPPPVLLVETDEYVIFKDIAPASKYHYLAIPKLHFESLNALNKSHYGLVKRMEEGMIEFLKTKNVDANNDTIIGFHIPPFISVSHLHLHGISPASEMSLLNKINFMESFWFKSAKSAREILEHREL